MTPTSDLVSFAFIAQTTMLVITCILLVYPIFTHARNVAHTRGLVLLAGAFLALTVSYVAKILLGMLIASAALDLVASVLVAAGVWQFARPFVRVAGQDVESPTIEDPTGGFESAGDD